MMELHRGATDLACSGDYLPGWKPLLALPLLLGLCTVSGHAQSTNRLLTWSDATRLSADTLRPVAPQVAASGGTVYVIWFNDATLSGPTPTDGIQFCRSADSGQSFSPPRRLVSFDSTLGTQGYLAAAGDHLTIAHLMPADTAPYYGVGVLTSSDAGEHWTPPQILRPGALPRFIVAADSNVILHYFDQTGRRYGTLRSGDFGAHWIASTGFVPELEDVQIQGGIVHGCGVDASGVHPEVGYYSSYTMGNSWFGPEIVSPQDAVASGSPRLAVDDAGTIFVAWIDTASVAVSRSVGLNEDDDIIWSQARVLSKQKGAVQPVIASAGSYLGIAWDNDFGGQQGLRLVASNNDAQSFSAIDTPSQSTFAVEPSMRMVDRRIYLAWADLNPSAPGTFFRTGTVTVDVRAKSFLLKQNFPNPFNGTTHIQYDIPVREHVTLTLYSLLGQRVKTLVDEVQDPLHYDVSVEAAGLASGVYFYRISTPQQTEVRKMVIVR